MRSVQLTIPRLMGSKRPHATPRFERLHLFLVPGAVGRRVAAEGVPVVAKGQLLGADGHGARVSPSWRAGQLVFAVLVVVA